MPTKSSPDKAKDLLCELFERYRGLFLERDSNNQEKPISANNAARQLAHDLISLWGIEPQAEQDKKQYPGMGGIASLQGKLSELFKKNATDQIQRIYNLDKEDRVKLLIRLLYLMRMAEQNEGAETLSPIFNHTDKMDEEGHIFEWLGWGEYLKWRVFREAIRPKPLPKPWKQVLSPAALRYPFTEPDSPIQQGPVVDYIDFFQSEEPLILQHDPSDIPLAHTILDRTVCPAEEIQCRWFSKEFELTVPGFKDFHNWLQGKLYNHPQYYQRILYNAITARLSSCRVRDNRPVFTFQPTRYFYYMLTNQLLQAHAEFKEETLLPKQFQGKALGGRTIRELLMPRNDQGLYLDSLETARTSNHLGLTCIVMTADRYILLFEREKTANTDPGKLGFITSMAMPYEVGVLPHTLLCLEGFKELGLQVIECLDHGNDDALPSPPRLLYLGTVMEWARGKPEMYFLARSRLTLAEHIERLAPTEAYAEGEDRTRSAVVSRPALELVRNKELFFRFDSRSDILEAIPRHVISLLTTGDFAFQEAAKGGLALLYLACQSKSEEHRELLRKYLPS